MFTATTIPKLELMFDVSLDRFFSGQGWQPFFIVGSPGLGKTQITKYMLRQQMADKLGVPLDDIGYFAFGANERDPAEAAGVGMPVKDAEGTWITRFLQSPMVTGINGTAKKYGVLALEELGAATQDMQKVLSALLDPDTREVGGVRIPEGWIPIANGNRAEDKCGAVATLSHLSDRVRFLDLKFDNRRWQVWAADNGVNELVREVVNALHTQGLFVDVVPSSRDSQQFCTPRSIVLASKDIDAIMDSVHFTGTFTGWMRDMIESNIGPQATEMVCTYLNRRDEVPSLDQIMRDPQGCKLSDHIGWQRVSAGIAINGIVDDSSADAAIQYVTRMRSDLQITMGTKLVKAVQRKGLSFSGSDTAQKFVLKYRDLLPLAA